MKNINKNMWVVFLRIREENYLLSLLPSRKGSSQIKEYVEQIWCNEFLSFEEQLHLLNRKKLRPCKAIEIGYNDVPCYGIRVICGEPEGEGVWAINSYAYIPSDKSIEIFYRVPSKFEIDSPEKTEWKYFIKKIKLLTKHSTLR